MQVFVYDTPGRISDAYPRVYLAHAPRVAHLLPAEDLDNEMSLCGLLSRNWAGFTPREEVVADSLPICRQCMRKTELPRWRVAS